MRITDSMRMRLTLADLGNINAENSRLLQQEGTGKKLLRPSDDPSGAIRQLRLHSDIQQQADEKTRIATGVDTIQNTSLALDDVVSVLQSAKELGVQGATSSLSTSEFQAIATQADQLLKQMVDIANRKAGDSYLFSGTATTTQPFTTTGSPVSAVTYNGDGNYQQLLLSPGTTVSLNLPGSQVFTTGQNVFQALIDLRDAAQNQDVQALSSTVSGELDTAFNQTVNNRTQVNAVQSRLSQETSSLDQISLSSKQLLSNVEDADVVDVLTKLQLTSAQRTATLQAIAKVSQATLLDYLA